MATSLRFRQATVLLSLIALAPLLGPPAALAFRKDLHFQTVFAVALAAGWTWRDAGIVASAEYAVDENEETVASLEISVAQLLPHQAPKSYAFHCFSKSDDQQASRVDDRNRDVKDNLARLEKKANQAIADAGKSPEHRTRALITVGVFVHCLTDSWSHAGYGGRAGHTFADVIGRSPDQTAQRKTKTAHAVGEAAIMLARFQAALNKDQLRTLKIDDLAAAISDDLNRWVEPDILMRLTRPEYARMPENPCVAALARHWSYRTIEAQKRLNEVPPQAVHPFVPSRFSTCMEVFGTVFKLPAGKEGRLILESVPAYPKLDLDGNPTVKSDGSYALTTAGTFDHAVIAASATATAQAGGCRYDVRATVRNLGPEGAPDAELLAAIVRENEEAAAGDSAVFKTLGPSQTIAQSLQFNQAGPCPSRAAFEVAVQPSPSTLGDRRPWSDQQASNNRWRGLVQVAPTVGH